MFDSMQGTRRRKSGVPKKLSADVDYITEDLAVTPAPATVTSTVTPAPATVTSSNGEVLDYSRAGTSSDAPLPVSVNGLSPLELANNDPSRYFSGGFNPFPTYHEQVVIVEPTSPTKIKPKSKRGPKKKSAKEKSVPAVAFTSPSSSMSTFPAALTTMASPYVSAHPSPSLAHPAGVPVTANGLSHPMTSPAGLVSSFSSTSHSNLTLKQDLFCPKCVKNFKSKEGWRIHMERHDGKSRYICPHCGKGFSAQTHLKAHMFEHTKVYAFYCKLCNMGFKYNFAEKKHRKTCKGVVGEGKLQPS